MKVNFNDNENKVSICEMSIGDTFKKNRTKPNSDEIAIYMIVDKSSGVFNSRYVNCIPTINLETGQIRMFAKDTLVKPIKAEVHCK